MHALVFYSITNPTSKRIFCNKKDYKRNEKFMNDINNNIDPPTPVVLGMSLLRGIGGIRWIMFMQCG